MVATPPTAYDVPLLTRWRDRLADATQQPRLVLAEGDDPRVRRAANALVGQGVVPVLVETPGTTAVRLAHGVETASVPSLAGGAAGARVAEIGARRGWSDQQVAERARNPLYLAAALVDLGTADAAVAGSLHPSGDVIRAGIHVIGLHPDARLLSSSFLLVLPDGSTMAFGDCAVVPDPDAEQLADIAVSTAATYRALTGEEPAVAMLSFSTHGSADHETVRRVRAATALVRERSPHLAVDGEMQFDAALVASVAAQKAAGSTVAGHANVCIFPNLAAGNIGYKIAQRLGGALAFGPIIQGLRAPMNDLSRGCTVDDIVNVSMVSALQAIALVDKALDPA